MTTIIPTIPVVIDDVRSRPGFEFTRCVYFTIEADDPSPSWFLRLQNQAIPFFMLGLSGIIHSPAPERSEFASPTELEAIINAVEVDDRLHVGMSDIWLPNNLFLDRKLYIAGNVFRTDAKLFSIAYRFRHNTMTLRRFLREASDLAESVRYSPLETKVFTEWARQRIEEARERYPKGGPDLALPWEYEGNAN